MDITGIRTDQTGVAPRQSEKFDTEAASDFSQTLQNTTATSAGSAGQADRNADVSSVFGMAGDTSEAPADAVSLGAGALDRLLAQSRVQQVSQQIANAMARRISGNVLTADFSQAPLAYAGLLSTTMNNANLLFQSAVPSPASESRTVIGGAATGSVLSVEPIGRGTRI
jgi:hypothetical protein